MNVQKKRFVKSGTRALSWVMVFCLMAGLLSFFPQTAGAAGAEDGWSVFASNPPYSPDGVAVDAQGNVYSVESNVSAYSRVWKYSSAGAVLNDTGWLIMDYDVYNAEGLAVSADGSRIYAIASGSRSNKAHILSGEGMYIGQLPADLAVGGAVDKNGIIYTVNMFRPYSQFAVQTFDPSGVPGESWGSSGSGVGQFGAPSGIAVGTDGTVYVSDTGNDRIQKRNPASGEYAVLGGTAFNNPRGVAVDALGNIYVADSGNNRIQRWDAQTGTWLSYGTAGGGVGQFNNPVGIAVDAAGNVFVADKGNSRIQKLANTAFPVLEEVSATRTADDTATVKLISNRVGEIYYALVDKNAPSPTVDTAGAGVPCGLGEATITDPEGLTAGAKDLYLVLKAEDGQISSPLMVRILGVGEAPTYRLTVCTGTGGTASEIDGEYEAGTPVGITAAPDSGYSFDGWTASGGGVFENAAAQSTTFTMPAGGVTITANFSLDSGAADTWDGTVATGFAGGIGTQSEPYRIRTGTQLAYLAQQINSNHSNFSGKYFHLMNDIDLNSLSWAPIGYGTLSFAGVLDGGGHAITNLTVGGMVPDSTAYTENAGLFGGIGEFGAVKNLRVTSAQVYNATSDTSGVCYTGILAGYNEGMIENCFVSGPVTTDSACSSACGGMVGINSGSIADSGSAAAVNGYSTSVSSPTLHMGGLVGLNAYGTVSRCYATGDVAAVLQSGSSTMVAGGLVGYAESAGVESSWATGNVAVAGLHDKGTIYAGGLIGYFYGNTSVKNCSAAGAVASRDGSTVQLGGFIGWSRLGGSARLENCFSTGSVAEEGGAAVHAGGLVGRAMAHIIQNCYATGGVEAGSGEVGGLIGFSDNTTVQQCYYNSDATQKVGGAAQTPVGSGQGTGGATATASAYMQTQKFVNELNANRGSNVEWKRVGGANGNYPVLHNIGDGTQADNTPPTLEAGTVTRTGRTTARVTFTTDKPGSYYYELAEDGAAAPGINTGAAGIACALGENTIANPSGLTSGAMDIYIVVKDILGNTSAALQMDIDIEAYAVAFDSQGGGEVASKSAQVHSTITAPADPIRTGYTFGGWYKEKECKNAWDFASDKVTQSITLYAKWRAVPGGRSGGLKPTPTPAPACAAAKTTGSNIALRAEPSKTSKLLGRLPKGAALQLLTYKNGYAQVEYQGVKCWVSMDYLSFSYAKPMHGIALSSIAIRKDMRTVSRRVASVPAGQGVPVLGRYGQWLLVQTTNGVAYTPASGVAVLDFTKPVTGMLKGAYPLYTQMNTTSRKFATPKKGAALKILSFSKGWFAVEYQGIPAFIEAKRVTILP